VKHYFQEGSNQCGKPHGAQIPDINIGGLGVAPAHNLINYSDAEGSLMLTPNADPHMNKTYLNGELVTAELPLEHGDRVLFGNNQLYIVVIPPKEIDKSLLDYEDAMGQMLQD
jgi:pSer/pThr/pTyr-binding forkhead associated (FHA) protein